MEKSYRSQPPQHRQMLFFGRQQSSVHWPGIILRPALGKESAYIYDFVDHRNPVFHAQARTRETVYQKEQITGQRQAA